MCGCHVQRRQQPCACDGVQMSARTAATTTATISGSVSVGTHRLGLEAAEAVRAALISAATSATRQSVHGNTVAVGRGVSAGTASPATAAYAWHA